MAVLRCNMISRKSTIFLLALIVIWKLLCLKILHITFINRFGVFVQVASLSSLYIPTLTSRYMHVCVYIYMWVWVCVWLCVCV